MFTPLTQNFYRSRHLFRCSNHPPTWLFGPNGPRLQVGEKWRDTKKSFVPYRSVLPDPVRYTDRRVCLAGNLSVCWDVSVPRLTPYTFDWHLQSTPPGTVLKRRREKYCHHLWVYCVSHLENFTPTPYVMCVRFPTHHTNPDLPMAP